MLTRQSSLPLTSRRPPVPYPQTFVRRNVLATCLPAEQSSKAKAKNINPAPRVVFKVSGDMHVNVGQDAQEAVEWDAVALSPEPKAVLQKPAVEAGKAHKMPGVEDADDVQRYTPGFITQLQLKVDTILDMLQLLLVPRPLQPRQPHETMEGKGAVSMEEPRLQEEKERQKEQQQQQQKEEQLQKQLQKEQEQLQQQQQQREQKERLRQQQQKQQEEEQKKTAVKLIENICSSPWAITPDGRRAVTPYGAKAMAVYDTATGALIATMEGKERSFLPDAISPDGPTAVCDYTLRVWDQARIAHFAAIPNGLRTLCVAISADGRHAVSGGADKAVWLWDLDAYACIGVLRQHRDSVRTVAITPDGRHAVSGSRDTTVRLWDLATRACTATLEGHTQEVVCMAITPDGRHAVSGSYDKTLRLWDLDTHTCVATMQGHACWILCVAITPDGRHAVSGSSDRTLRLWDLAAHACVATKALESYVTSMFITPDGRNAAFMKNDKVLDKWDLAAYLDTAAVE